MNEHFYFQPIGYVDTPIKKMVDENWGNVESKIVIKKEYENGTEGLDQFSHAIIITFLHPANFDKLQHLQRHPQGRKDLPEIGIFSQRAKHRPNPIGITAVKIIGLNKGCLIVKGLDAIDGTPVIDIKPYYPQYDRIEETIVPWWVEHLMEKYF